MVDTNAYIRELVRKSGLHLLCNNQLRSAYTGSKERGLFHMFVHNEFLNHIRCWTNEKLHGKHKPRMTPEFFFAYLGVEIAASLNPQYKISDYWSSKEFIGNHDIASVMSRQKFMTARANVKHYPVYDEAVASKDPLWHSRSMLNHFWKNCVKNAVPLGVTAFDENGIRSRGRCAAISYIKMKPDQYAIRLYASVSWAHTYMHTFSDNGSGNKFMEDSSCALSYAAEFRAISKLLRHMDGMDDMCQGTLWMLMMAHQTKLYPDPTGRRLFVTNNYYTRHILAKNLKKKTDGEARMTGTMKWTNMRAHDRDTLAKATAVLDKKLRGAWVLCQVRESKEKPTRASGGGRVGVPVETLPDIIGREFVDLEDMKIDAMNCAQLRIELKARNLLSSGLKTILQVRLKLAITDRVESAIRAAAPVPVPEDVVMGGVTSTVVTDPPPCCGCWCTPPC